MDSNTNSSINQNDNGGSDATDVSIISKEDLISVGIDLPEDQMKSLIRYAEDAISERIGEEIISSLKDDQVQELLFMQDSVVPDEQIEKWLIERVTDYEEIVKDNVAIVLGDLAENADAIVGAQ